MPLIEPHNGVCPDCDGLLITAVCLGSSRSVTLDATPVPDGEYTAWLGPHHGVWYARRHDPAAAFHGMRRRLHECRPPDLQLEIGA